MNSVPCARAGAIAPPATRSKQPPRLSQPIAGSLPDGVRRATYGSRAPFALSRPWLAPASRLPTRRGGSHDVDLSDA
jgi:hypothetical protein